MGHAFGTLDELGEGYGFRKIRQPLGVTAFGANAIVLPHILDFSRDAAAARLADLALAIGAGTRSESAAVLAERFIAKVRELALRIGIPEKLDTLRAADVPLIARRALDEAQGFYPVPRFMNQSECEAVLRKLLP